MKQVASYLLAVSLLACCAIDAHADNLGQRSAQRLKAQAEEPSEVLVFFKPGTDVDQCTREHGMQKRHRLRSDANAFVLKAASPQAAKSIKQKLAKDSRVRSVYLNRYVYYEKQELTPFVPDDPYFYSFDTWPGQWHLINEDPTGLDINVEPVWNAGFTGDGVTIGILDDCLEIDHPDLIDNYVADYSWDFYAMWVPDDGDPEPDYGDPDPSPDGPDDYHGISVAGVAAARGGNGIGVTGVAPKAGLAGLRVPVGVVGTTAQFVDAILYHSSGAYTNIKVKNHSHVTPLRYEPSAGEADAIHGSIEAGTIHCFAAGNYRGSPDEDSTKLGLQNSPDAITVAALGSDGKYASYSNFGACVFVTAPSSSSENLLKITTTDRTTESYGYNGYGDSFPYPDYTTIFSGTSASCPIVSGVMALGKEVQPALNQRFAKHLLVRSCDMVDPYDPDWETNGAGYHFNPNYGFGLINAAEFIRLAQLYSDVTPPIDPETISIGPTTIDLPNNIPDYPASISRTFEVDNTTPLTLEEIQVTLSFSHQRCGDLEAYLTSPPPNNTRCRLMKYRSGDNAENLTWTYTTNAFWGENPSGTWTISICDRITGYYSGSWISYSVTMRMGKLEPITTGPPIIAAHPTEQMVHFGQSATFHVEAVGAPTLTYQWQKDGSSPVYDDGNITGATTDTLQIATVDGNHLGSYSCVVSNGETAISDAADLRIVYIVESRGDGHNYKDFSTIGTFFPDNNAKSIAPLTTPDIGSRWAKMTTGSEQAKYRFMPPVRGRYEIYSTWPASANATDELEHIITHAGGWDSEVLDQNSVSNPDGANAWNSLGQYNLMLGDPYDVTQSDVDNPGSGIFWADAVMWELIDLNGGPAITMQPEQQDVCPAGEAFFTVEATGEGNLTYQWQKKPFDTDDYYDIPHIDDHYYGETTATLRVYPVVADAGDTGVYRCVVTDDKGSTTSNEAILMVTPSQIIAQPTDQTPPLTGTAIFKVEAVGLGTIEYQWQKDGNDLVDDDVHIFGATKNELRIYNAVFNDQGTYACIVRITECGSMESNNAQLTIYTDSVEYIVESTKDGHNYDQCTITGDWTTAYGVKSYAPGTMGIGSLFSSVGVNRAVTYHYTPIVSGRYNVYATWETSYNECYAAKHEVTYHDGTETVYLDQRFNSHQWNLLGEFSLLTNEEYSVTQYAKGSLDARSYIRADAVKWELAGIGFTAPLIAEQPTPTTLREGETATFTVVAYGEEPLTYQWQKDETDIHDDGIISGATTATLQINDLLTTDAGDYRCVVKDKDEDSVTSDSATLDVIIICLENGDFEIFEEDDYGNVTNPVASDWTAFTRIGDVTLNRSDVKYAGTYSQQIDCDANSDGGIFQQIDVVPGRNYTISAYIKCDKNNGGMEGLLGVDPYGDTDPFSLDIWWGSKNYDYFSKKAWTGQAMSEKITVYLRAIQHRSSEAGTVWFDTAAPACIEPVAPTAPVATSAYSCKTHGAAGDFCIDVDNGEIECRKGGVTQLIVTFDQDIQPTDGSFGPEDIGLVPPVGTVTDVIQSAPDELIIGMFGTTNGETFTVSFLNTASAADASLVCNDSVCIQQLIGDVNSDAVITALDRVLVRDQMVRAVDAGNFRMDVEADGTFTALDRVKVRDAMTTGLIGSCP